MTAAGSGLRIWDPEQEDTILQWLAAGSDVHDFVFTADGKRVLIAADTADCGVWDLNSEEQVLRFKGPPVVPEERTMFSFDLVRETPCIALSEDGRLAAAGWPGEKTTMIWRLPQAPRAGQ